MGFDDKEAFGYSDKKYITAVFGNCEMVDNTYLPG